MLTILVLILPFILPDLDIDSDGFMAREERAVGCDPFNRESFPVCGDLDGVSRRTLQSWRQLGDGPPWYKLSRAVKGRVHSILRVAGRGRGGGR